MLRVLSAALAAAVAAEPTIPHQASLPRLAPAVVSVETPGRSAPSQALAARLKPFSRVVALRLREPFGPAPEQSASVAVPWLGAHYAGAAAGLGGAANVCLGSYSFFQIVANHRNLRALKDGGARAAAASKRLSGVSAPAQSAATAANLLNLPTFLASGSPALIANALVQAAGAYAVVTQLALAGHFPRWKWAGVTVGAAALLALPLAVSLSPPVVHGAGLAATAISAAFPLLQILKNRRSSAESLAGVQPMSYFVQMAGNLLLVPVLLTSGAWYNVLGDVVGIVGPLIILSQLSRAGFFPKTAWRTSSIASAALYGLMTLASLSVPGSFWLR